MKTLLACLPHRAVSVLAVLASVLLAACSSNAVIDDFRGGDRPTFDRQVAANDLRSVVDRGGTVIDVRLREDFAANPVLLPNAEYRNPELVSQWVSEVRDSEKPVVVYCVRGKWVSQKVAHYLDSQGVEVYSLEGGIEAWQMAGNTVTE